MISYEFFVGVSKITTELLNVYRYMFDNDDTLLFQDFDVEDHDSGFVLEFYPRRICFSDIVESYNTLLSITPSESAHAIYKGTMSDERSIITVSDARSCDFIHLSHYSALTKINKNTPIPSFSTPSTAEEFEQTAFQLMMLYEEDVVDLFLLNSYVGPLLEGTSMKFFSATKLYYLSPVDLNNMLVLLQEQFKKILQYKEAKNDYLQQVQSYQ